MGSSAARENGSGVQDHFTSGGEKIAHVASLCTSSTRNAFPLMGPPPQSTASPSTRILKRPSPSGRSCCSVVT